MAGVEIMAFAEAFVAAESIEDPVSDVEQPGTEGKQQRRENRHVEPHGPRKEPRPERGYSRRIQAKQVPPSREVV